MKIKDLLIPAQTKFLKELIPENSFTLFYNTQFFSETDSINEIDSGIAIIGVPDLSNSYESEKNNAANQIRKELYKLYYYPDFPKIYDFGNIKPGKTIEDTYVAIREVVCQLLKNNFKVVCIGGSVDFSYSLYKAIAEVKSYFNITAIAPKLYLEINKNNKHSFLEKIILNTSSKLFGFTNLGYQSYMVSHKEIELLEKLDFDSFRLGLVRNNLLEYEPIIRDSNLIIIDMKSVKGADAPATEYPNPNGFYSEEICQLSKYAGLSNKTNCIGIFETEPVYDQNSISVKLNAEIIWNFIQGYANNQNDSPINNPDQLFMKFTVNIEGVGDGLLFLKNKKSLRWWMEIPEKYIKTKQNIYIACSANDYQKACNNEIPDRLLSMIKKFY